MDKHNITTKWRGSNKGGGNEEIGTLRIDKNTIDFTLQGCKDVFAKRFVGQSGAHYYKVHTFGIDNRYDKGIKYRVSKVFLYNSSQCFEMDDDYIQGITSFSFEVMGLAEWLGLRSVGIGVVDGTNMLIQSNEVPEISLMDGDIRVYIKYEIKNFFKNTDSLYKMTIENKPRIYVELKNSTTDKKVSEIIGIIMRFWSLIIGKIAFVNDIRLISEQSKYPIGMYLNHDYSYDLGISYIIWKPRFEKSSIEERLGYYFKNWYKFCNDESYEMLLNTYFNLHSEQRYSIEDMFIAYCKFLEGYDLRKSQDEEKATNLKVDVIKVLEQESISQIFRPIFKKAGSKFNKDSVAGWIAGGFLGRISLAQRIRKVDEQHFGFIANNYYKVYSDITVSELYQWIANTRNYYSHYKDDKSNILDLQGMYILLPILNSVVCSILLEEMGMNKEVRKDIFKKDINIGRFFLE